MKRVIPNALKTIAVSAVLAVLVGWGHSAAAQFETKPMSVGSLYQQYSEIGSEPYPTGGWDYQWPAIMPWAPTAWYSTLWVAVEDFEDPDGEEWPAKIAHAGPRATGTDEFFPTEFKTVSRFEPPYVEVDGLPSFNHFPDNDEVDPSMGPTRQIVSTGNTVTGISFERTISAYSQSAHDNYHIIEYVFTNTGNTDQDDDIELENRTLDGVYFSFQRRPRVGNWMVDWVGDGMEEYETDVRATIQWWWPRPDWDQTLGYPLFRQEWFAQESDTVGRLHRPQFAGNAMLHVDQSASNSSNDMSQPSMTGHVDSDDELMTTNNSALQRNKMVREYDFLSETGHMYPHHADIVKPDGDFTTKGGDPMQIQGKFSAGGWSSVWAHGPYTLGPGESIRIVQVEAVDGLDTPEATFVGRRFSEAGRDEEAPITYRGVTMNKNEWWYSGRDSLMQTFQRAQAAFDNDYHIPKPPLPPSDFIVTSGVNSVHLEWTTFDGASPVEFEVYRGLGRVEGQVEKDYQYDLIATVPFEPGQTQYSVRDENVTRGIDYYYYIQAVGKPSENSGDAFTPAGPLRSNRYLTQTYDPATLRRPPGGSASDTRVVPNPYNIASDKEVRWPDERDKLGFLDIPGQCTIKIYTELGELIKTIEHTDGSGDEFWDLTTESRQLIVSGVYIAVIDDHETGDRVHKKFSVIR